jgi:hypothetical protein
MPFSSMRPATAMPIAATSERAFPMLARVCTTRIRSGSRLDASVFGDATMAVSRATQRPRWSETTIRTVLSERSIPTTSLPLSLKAKVRAGRPAAAFPVSCETRPSAASSSRAMVTVGRDSPVASAKSEIVAVPLVRSAARHSEDGLLSGWLIIGPRY